MANPSAPPTAITPATWPRSATANPNAARAVPENPARYNRVGSSEGCACPRQHRVHGRDVGLGRSVAQRVVRAQDDPAEAGGAILKSFEPEEGPPPRIEREQHRPPPLGRVARREIESECLRSEEHTSELQSLAYLVCRLLLE